MIEKLSTQDYLNLFHNVKPKKRNKFNATKVKCDGITFDSRREYQRYGELKLLQMGGEISDLEVHVKYDFPLRTEKGKFFSYEADFRYLDNATGEIVVEDSKGMVTQIYKLKKSLMMFFYDIEIKESLTTQGE